MLATFTGEVSVKREAGDEWFAGAERMDLFENDKVRTARSATAQVRFGNGSTVTMAEDALIAIAETRSVPGRGRTDLTVVRGRIDAELENSATDSLSVATPTAVVRAGREIVFQ